MTFQNTETSYKLHNQWTLKHKPQTLDDIYEHKQVVNKLKAMTKTNLFSHIYLIGPSGSGKKTIIRAFLKTLDVHPSNLIWIYQTHTKSQDLKSRILNFLSEKKTESQKWIVIQNTSRLPYYFRSLLHSLFTFPNLTLIFIDVKNNSLDTRWWNHWCIHLSISHRTYQECYDIAKQILEKENISLQSVDIDTLILASQQNFYCFMLMIQIASLKNQEIVKCIYNKSQSFPCHNILYHPELSHKIQLIHNLTLQGYFHYDITIHLYNYIKANEISVDDLIEIGKVIQVYSIYDQDPYTLLAAISKIHLRNFVKDV